MAAAWCPQDYSCQFTQIHPRVVTHAIGPWWHGTWGVVTALVAIVAIACVLALVVYVIAQGIDDKRARKERELQRKQQLAVEEQRTMQLDAAKGNAEMLKVVQGWDHNRYNF